MLYAIAGNGVGPVKEITGALKDLRDRASSEDAEFWLVLEGKDEPTKTDLDILGWITKQEVWFEVYTTTGTTYDGAQETHVVDDVYEALLERCQERIGESEDAAILVLLPEDDVEDADLQRLVEAAIDGGVSVFAVNGEMARITLEGDESESAEDVPEPEPVKAATKKAAAKAAAPVKKAAKKAAATPAEPTAEDIIEAVEAAPEPDDEAEGAVIYTPEELGRMTVAELGSVARGQGIDPKGLGKRDLIDAIKIKLYPAPEAVSPNGTSGNGEVLVVLHFHSAVITKMMPEAAALALVAQ